MNTDVLAISGAGLVFVVFSILTIRSFHWMSAHGRDRRSVRAFTVAVALLIVAAVHLAEALAVTLDLLVVNEAVLTLGAVGSGAMLMAALLAMR